MTFSKEMFVDEMFRWMMIRQIPNAKIIPNLKGTRFKYMTKTQKTVATMFAWQPPEMNALLVWHKRSFLKSIQIPAILGNRFIFIKQLMGGAHNILFMQMEYF